MHICSGYFTQVSEPWPVGLLFFVLFFLKILTGKACSKISPLMSVHFNTFTTLWAKSADNKLMMFFPENSIWHFMQIFSSGDNLYDMSKPVFWDKYEKSFIQYVIWKFYADC